MHRFSPDFIKSAVTGVKLDKTLISPNNDGINDTVSVTVTITQDFSGSIIVENSVGAFIKNILPGGTLKPGTYTVTWDGTDSNNKNVYNGTYYIAAYMWATERPGSYRFEDAKITVTDSVKLTVPQPEQRARVKYAGINAYVDLNNNPSYPVAMNQVFPIISYTPNPRPSYMVKLAEEAPGWIPVDYVDITDISTIPERWGKPAIAGAIARVEPLNDFPIKVMLEKNALVRILRQDGDWYRIMLSTGEQLYVRTMDIEEIPAGIQATYTVISGDTLWKIAQRYGVTVDAIIKANNLNINLPLVIGQKLQIPPKTAGTQPAASNIYLVPTSIPEIAYVKLSTRTVAYQGSSAPSYLTVDLETKVPTRGYIDVTGSTGATKINLSTDEYKKEHIVFWVPWDDNKKQPLAVGEYQLKLNLSMADGTAITGVDLGKLTVVAESKPKPVITNTYWPQQFTPSIDPNKSTTDFGYMVNRPLKVQIIIKDDKKEYYHTPLETKLPGAYYPRWYGRDDQGNLMPNGTYTVELRAIDPFYNYPELKVYYSQGLQIINSDFRIPEDRVRQVVKEVKLNNLEITPNGDGVQDVVTGTVTFISKAKAEVNIVNALGSRIKQVLPYNDYEPGTYTFTWDGKIAFSNSIPLNGSYYAEAVIYENGNRGGIIYRDQPIKLSGSYGIQVPEPQQKVKVISDITEIYLNQEVGGTYYGKKGEIYTIIDFSMEAEASYTVRITENITGWVKVYDVEMIDLDTIPQKWGVTVVDGVSVRPAPIDYYPAITVLPKGAKVRILRQDNKGYRVVLSTGKQAYIQTTDLVETTPPVQSGAYYTIISGDTLWKIAQKFGVTVDSIIRANNINANTPIFIGQRLIIPANIVQSPVLVPQVAAIYTVKSGDTLWRIAQQYGVTLAELMRANTILASQPLYVGYKLNIPKVYIANASQTLSYIASINYTTVQNLAQLNNIDPNKPLTDGQRLLISL